MLAVLMASHFGLFAICGALAKDVCPLASRSASGYIYSEQRF